MRQLLIFFGMLQTNVAILSGAGASKSPLAAIGTAQAVFVDWRVDVGAVDGVGAPGAADLWMVSLPELRGQAS